MIQKILLLIASILLFLFIGEIIARILRYQKEVGSGMEELKTVEIAQEVLGKFDRIYQIKI